MKLYFSLFILLILDIFSKLTKNKNFQIFLRKSMNIFYVVNISKKYRKEVCSRSEFFLTKLNNKISNVKFIIEFPFDNKTISLKTFNHLKNHSSYSYCSLEEIKGFFFFFIQIYLKSSSLFEYFLFFFN